VRTRKCGWTGNAPSREREQQERRASESVGRCEGPRRHCAGLEARACRETAPFFRCAWVDAPPPSRLSEAFEAGRGGLISPTSLDLDCGDDPAGACAGAEECAGMCHGTCTGAAGARHGCAWGAEADQGAEAPGSGGDPGRCEPKTGQEALRAVCADRPRTLCQGPCAWFVPPGRCAGADRCLGLDRRSCEGGGLSVGCGWVSSSRRAEERSMPPKRTEDEPGGGSHVRGSSRDELRGVSEAPEHRPESAPAEA
jgi:hypothetical protein